MKPFMSHHSVELHDDPVLPVTKRGRDLLRDPLLNNCGKTCCTLGSGSLAYKILLSTRWWSPL